MIFELKAGGGSDIRIDLLDTASVVAAVEGRFFVGYGSIRREISIAIDQIR